MYFKHRWCRLKQPNSIQNQQWNVEYHWLASFNACWLWQRKYFQYTLVAISLLLSDWIISPACLAYIGQLQIEHLSLLPASWPMTTTSRGVTAWFCNAFAFSFRSFNCSVAHTLDDKQHLIWCKLTLGFRSNAIQIFTPLKHQSICKVFNKDMTCLNKELKQSSLHSSSTLNIRIHLYSAGIFRCQWS